MNEVNSHGVCGRSRAIVGMATLSNTWRQETRKLRTSIQEPRADNEDDRKPSDVQESRPVNIPRRAWLQCSARMSSNAFSYAASEYNKSERSERTIDRLSALACVRPRRDGSPAMSSTAAFPSLRNHEDKS